jgi:hypothetical protein
VVVLLLLLLLQAANQQFTAERLHAGDFHSSALLMSFPGLCVYQLQPSCYCFAANQACNATFWF